MAKVLARQGVMYTFVGTVVFVLTACSTDTASEDPSDPNGSPIVVEFDRSDTALAEMLSSVISDTQNNPESGAARGRLGMAYEINDFKSAAIDTYAQAAALDPAEFVWPYFRSQLLAEVGETDAALEVLDTAIAIDGEHPPAWLWRGSWLRDLGRFDEAAEAFERAYELGGGSVAKIGLAQTRMRQSRPADALSLLKPLTQSGHPHVHRLLGRAHQALGNTDEARIALARGRQAAPAQWRDPRHNAKWEFLASYGGRLVHAEQLLKAGQFDEVIEVLEPMRETNPDDEAVVANLAMAYGRTERMERALQLIEHGFEVHPDYFRFHNVLASLHYHTGDLEKALDHLGQSIEISAAQSWPYQQRGTILMREGRYDESLAAFDEALKFGIDNPEEIHHKAGMIEGARERWPEAIDRFERAAAIDEAFTMTYVYLGRSLAEAGRFPEAKSALDWADRLDTHPRERRDARARLATLESDSDDATPQAGSEAPAPDES